MEPMFDDMLATIKAEYLKWRELLEFRQNSDMIRLREAYDLVEWAKETMADYESPEGG